MRVGVALPQYSIDVEDRAPVWPAMLLAAHAAERRGLDSVWLSDHPFAVSPDGEVSGALDPIVAASALLCATKGIRVGTLVLAASMRSPAIVSHALATLAPSRGRMVAGLGAGWSEPEHRAFGVPLPRYAVRAEMLERAVSFIAGLGAPPEIWAGGTGLAVLDLAARYADAWNVAWDPSPSDFDAANARLDEACMRAGRDPITLERTVGLTVLVARDEAGLERAVERLRGRAAFLAGISRDELSRRIVCGVPEECAERIAAYRADEVVAALLLRDDPAMLELFATEVAPHLRRLGRRRR